MRFPNSVVIAILISTVFATGGEQPPATGEEIRALIDQLVYPNPKPIADKGPSYRLPEGFDRDKQKLVHKARHKLKQLGPVAFPYLIERWDDKRYCITMSVGINGFCFNATVGDVC